MWSTHILVVLSSFAWIVAVESLPSAWPMAPYTWGHRYVKFPLVGNIHACRRCHVSFPGLELKKTPKPEGVSLVFVIDSTGSMYDDLRQVRRGIKSILKTMFENHDTSIDNYVLVFFNDPLIGPYRITTDPWKFIEKLDSTTVYGGGDCEERSLGGLLLAVNHSLPRSFIFVFTDAGAKDLYLRPKLEAAIQEKQSQVIFVLTGDCGDPEDPRYKVYESIAAMSFGQVFDLHKTEINQILMYVNHTIHEKNRVNIVSRDVPHPGKETFVVPVDSETNSMTISLSGKDPVVEVENPEGQEVAEVPVLDVETAVVMEVPHPEEGNWSVEVGSSSDHHVRIYGSSNFTFQYGFAGSPFAQLEETSLSPEIGTETILVVNVTHQIQLNMLTRVWLRKQAGNIFASLDLQRVEGQPNLYRTKKFLTPHEQFYLQIHGVDNYGHPVVRISPTAIIPRAPASTTTTTEVPWWRVPVTVTATPEKVYFMKGETVKLTCIANGPYNIMLQWRKAGELLKALNSTANTPGKQHILTLDIAYANQSNEGKYECIASSSWKKGVAAATMVYVQYPTIINKTNDVLSLENATVILQCNIEGEPKPTISWLKNGRKIKPELYQITPDGKLILQHVKVSDAGAFTCIGMNSLGQVQETINLDVGLSPQFSQVPMDTVIPLNGNGTIPCQVNGKPKPEISWRRIDGKEIDKTRITAGESCSLIFSVAKYEDRGTYAVTVENDYGSMEISAVVTISGADVPAFDPNYQETQASVGDTIILPCYASGQPPPEYQWTRNGYPISNTAQNTLVLGNLQAADAGIYKCEASNVVGKAEKTFNVIVIPPPNVQK